MGSTAGQGQPRCRRSCVIYDTSGDASLADVLDEPGRLSVSRHARDELLRFCYGSDLGQCREQAHLHSLAYWINFVPQ